MNADAQSTRDRIVAATIVCLERVGMQGVTIRGIAEEAGVNVAAVNYHFGSKSQLLEETLRQSRHQEAWASVGELDQAIQQAGGDVLAGLVNHLHEFLGNAINWPRLTEAQLHEILAGQDYDTPIVSEMNAFAHQFADRLRPALPNMPEMDIKLAVAQVWSVLVLLSLLPHVFDEFLGAPMSDPALRRRYVERLVLGLRS